MNENAGLAFKAENRLGVTCLTLTGSLDINSRKKLTKIAQILRDNKAQRTVLDFSGLVSIDAMGYVALLNFKDIMEKAGAITALCCISPDVFDRIVKSEGLGKFKIFKSLQDAVDVLVVSPTGFDAEDKMSSINKNLYKNEILKKPVPPIESDSIRAILKTWEELEEKEEKNRALNPPVLTKAYKGFGRYFNKRGAGVIIFALGWFGISLFFMLNKTGPNQSSFIRFNFLMSLAGLTGLFLNRLAGAVTILTGLLFNLLFPFFQALALKPFPDLHNLFVRITENPDATRASLAALLYCCLSLLGSKKMPLKPVAALFTYASTAWLTAFFNSPLVIIAEKRLFNKMPLMEPLNISIIITLPVLMLFGLGSTIKRFWRLLRRNKNSKDYSAQRAYIRKILIIRQALFFALSALVWAMIISGLFISAFNFG